MREVAAIATTTSTSRIDISAERLPLRLLVKIFEDLGQVGWRTALFWCPALIRTLEVTIFGDTEHILVGVVAARLFAEVVIEDAVLVAALANLESSAGRKFPGWQRSVKHSLFETTNLLQSLPAVSLQQIKIRRFDSLLVSHHSQFFLE